MYLHTLAEQIVSKVMEMKLLRLRDARSDNGLVKQHG